MKPVLVIAHRGASGERPEHTLAAYELAIEQGADYVETDLVITRDGVLVARHENELSTTTDVAEHREFASRRTTKVIDGESKSGWFSEDFTLAELKALRAVERIPDIRPANARFDRQFDIPTLAEILDLIAKRQAGRRSPIGFYPETKHPTYFRSIGLPLEEPLVAALHMKGYTSRDAPIFLQSFEVGNLRELKRMTRLRLIQLLGRPEERPFDLAARNDARTYGDLATKAGLLETATYADGVGVHKDLVIPRDKAARLLKPTSLVHDAHKAGLVVHAWTFRNENMFLPADFRRGHPQSGDFLRSAGDALGELRRFAAQDVDGVFTDFPATALRLGEA